MIVKKRQRVLTVTVCFVLSCTLYKIPDFVPSLQSSQQIVSRDACHHENILFEQLQIQRHGPEEIRREKHLQYQSLPLADTLEEILAFPSLNNDSTADTSVTVILNHYNRTTLCRQLTALLEQSILPTYVWVLLFDAPLRDTAKSIIAAYNKSIISIVESQHDFRFFGRFQLALQANTKYVWVLDDDMIPGKLYMEQCLHAIGTMKYRGLIGSVGWRLPNLPEYGQSFPTYYAGGSYLPDPRFDLYMTKALEVDMLCSMWFMERDWVRYLFREKEITFNTGEDFLISFALRKYANIRSYILPVNVKNRSTWGDSDHRFAYIQATTQGQKQVARRNALWYTYFMRGSYLVQGEKMISECRSGIHMCTRPVLLVIDGLRQAKLVVNNIKRWVSDEKKFVIAITGGSRGNCTEMLPVLSLGLHTEYCSGAERRPLLFDLSLGSSLNTRVNHVVASSDTYIGLSGICNSVYPSKIMVIHDTGDKISSVIMGAVRDVANNLNVSFEALPHTRASVLLDDV